MTIKTRAARLSVLSNLTLTLMKLAVGLMSGSVAILSEAAHSANDLVAAVMAYFSVRVADVPADREHPFGHGKIENLSGTIEAALIFGVSIYICYEAIQKLIFGGEVRNLSLGIAVMVISAIVNIAVSRLLFRVAKETDSVALEADAHHLSVDVYTSIAVFTGLGLMWALRPIWPRADVLDPIIGLIVAAIIARVAFGLVKKAGAPLIDVGLPQPELDKLNQILCSDPRVLAYHKLRTRKSGGERHVDVHLLVENDLSLSEGHRLAEEVEDKIRAEFDPVHVITHVEPIGEEEVGETGVWCRLDRVDKAR
ncbi:MAG: cation diffusion facilitator family transporter [Armatimonadota bacterium]|nr:cation diffusion facilitator family transporter [Armatimonadota bacterium]